MPPDQPGHGEVTDGHPAPTSAAATADGLSWARTASDSELIAAHVAGDRNAFGEIVRRHRDRLWAVALRTLSDREDAADALQDALLSAYRAAGSFRGDSAVTTWLHRIVVNACLDRARRGQVRRTVPLPETGPDEPVQPGDAISDRDTTLVVHRALAELPIEQRAALVLVDLHGHSVVEAAQLLGVAEGTVKSRCSRARARLAVSLGYLRNPARAAGVQPATPATDRSAEGGAP